LTVKAHPSETHNQWNFVLGKYPIKTVKNALPRKNEHSAPIYNAQH